LGVEASDICEPPAPVSGSLKQKSESYEEDINILSPSKSVKAVML
jgi:hypothetical protein